MSVPNDSPQLMANETVPPSPVGIPANLARLTSELRELVHDHLELATLETRLSINTLVRMVALSIVTALLFASAWLALVGSAGLGLASLGVPPVLVMLILAATNLLVALLGWLRIKRLSLWLGWAASQRAFKSDSVTEASGVAG